MMTPIDAIRSGIGFDEAGHWHQARPASELSVREESDDPISAGRGAILGGVISSALWVGLFVAGRVLWTLITKS